MERLTVSVVLKLPCVSESPRGLAKTLVVGLLKSQILWVCEFASLASVPGDINATDRGLLEN